MKIIITAMAALILFVACDKKSKEAVLNRKVQERALDQKEYRPESGNADFIADTTTIPTGKPEDKKQPIKAQSIPNPDWDKKIIKNASLNLEVKDYTTYYTTLREKIRSLGGYVAQEEQSLSDYKTENVLTIKVPVDQFDNAVALLTNKVEKLNEKKISSQDVTTEFVDSKSRMEAKKQVRQRYMDLLKQAKNMEEILSVQSEINGVQEEIEAATGRIEYLGHSSVFSTINLTFFQVLNSSAKSNDSPSFGKKIGNAFKTGSEWVIDLFVGLVSIWPLFLLGFTALIFWKRFKAKTINRPDIIKDTV